MIVNGSEYVYDNCSSQKCHAESCAFRAAGVTEIDVFGDFSRHLELLELSVRLGIPCCRPPCIQQGHSYVGGVLLKVSWPAQVTPSLSCGSGFSFLGGGRRTLDERFGDLA